MGGGGGGYSVSRDELEDLKRQVDERTRSSVADAEINSLLNEELARVNFRDTDKISEYLDAITEALGDEVDVERLLFGGSIAKHTYVDGLSDVDSLVVIKGDDLADLSPADLRQRLADALEGNLAKGDIAKIEQGNLAVTVTYNDGTEIQLVAARESKGGTEISSADGERWKAINPRQFAETLTHINQQQNGAVVPAIKLAKGVIDGLSGEAQLSGYHVEALAVAAFTDYNGASTPKEMLTHFFSSAAETVKRPIGDSTGQSQHIDESLGPADSTARQAAAAELSRVAGQMESATSVEEWRQLLGS